MDLSIRRVGPEEAGTVHAIMIDAFQAYRDALPPTSALNETVASVRRDLENGEGAILCTLDGRPVGSARYSIKEGLYFHRLAVLRSDQGQGAGAAMVKWLVEEGVRAGQRVIWLKVRASEPRNVTYYHRQGFVVSGEADELNPNGHQVRIIRMYRPLPS
jgi:ribosomal protein S18 acetylase RimI-like enzyme